MKGCVVVLTGQLEDGENVCFGCRLKKLLILFHIFVLREPKVVPRRVIVLLEPG